MSDNDGEDDYMSDAFLAQLSTEDNTKKAPKSKFAQRKQREKERKEKLSRKIQTPIQKKKDVEAAEREKALSTAISENNKGFALLAKMGYKPGMGLGKSNDGIKEPIGIDIYNKKEGIGQKKEEERKVQIKIKQDEERIVQMKLKADDAKQKYLLWLTTSKNMKRVKRDLCHSQHSCEMLDRQNGVLENEFWYKPPEVKEEEEPEEGQQYQPTSVKILEEKKSFEEEAKEDYESLRAVTEYLRTRYFYCCWCGYQHASLERLQSDCPGDTAELHDD